jgi:hypothetical protein
MKKTCACFALFLVLFSSPAVFAEAKQDKYAAYAQYEKQTYEAFCLHRNAQGEKWCEITLSVPRFPGAKWLDALLVQKVTGAPPSHANFAADYQAFVGVDEFTQRAEQEEDDEFIISSGGEFHGEMEFGGRYGDYLQFSYFVHTVGAGAAHGASSVKNFLLNLDTRAPVALEEILVAPQKRAALDDLQRDSYRGWLVEHGMTSSDRKEQDAFLAEWFTPNGNWKIVKGGLAFDYDDYEAGPFAMGSPEIRVSKAFLHGIVKPEILRLIPW